MTIEHAKRATTSPSKVVELTPKKAPNKAASGDERTSNSVATASALYGVAMLKIAVELKKSKSASVDQIVADVLVKMRIDETQFRHFMDSNGGLLRTIARREA